MDQIQMENVNNNMLWLFYAVAVLLGWPMLAFIEVHFYEKDIHQQYHHDGKTSLINNICSTYTLFSQVQQ